MGVWCWPHPCSHTHLVTLPLVTLRPRIHVYISIIYMMDTTHPTPTGGRGTTHAHHVVMV